MNRVPSLFMGNCVALITVSIWGFTFVSTRILLESFVPAEILFMRFMLGYIALRFAPAPAIPFASLKEEALFALAGLTGVTLYFLFENMALLYTYVSNVGVLVASAPLLTAIFACLLLKAPLPRINYYIGFLLAMLGIFLITHHGSEMRFNFLGDGLALAAALTWGIYSVIIRKLSCMGHNSLAITRRVFFYGLLFMLPLICGGEFHIPYAALMRPVNIANLLFLGLGASALCFASWTFSLKILGATRASVYIYLVPVISILSSIFILGEKPSFYTFSGAFLTILGLIVSEYHWKQRGRLQVN